MNVNDKPKKNDGEAADKRPQRCVSSIESSAGSGEKIVFGLVQPVPSPQTINLPPKPTHSPPPVPTNAIRAGSLHSSTSDELASFPTGAPPPKPPRMKKETRESYNAYDNDDPMPCEVIGAFGFVPSSAPPPQSLSQQQSQQSDGDVRMRIRGWFEEIDDEGNSYFAHPDSADQWVKTESEDGKVYYYERGSRRSAWDLPNVEPCGITSNAAGLKRPTSTLNDHLPSAPVSSVTPGNINTIDLSEAQAKFGARKLLPSVSGDSLSPIPVQDESSSRFYRVSKDHITGPIENKLRGTERRGQVTFTRCSGGRSIKKAIACILVLSGPTLYIYKESKNQKGSHVSGKPEVELHVKDLQVLSVDDSDCSFMLVDTTDTDNVSQYLIETPSSKLRKAWETALKYSKDFDKEDRFDRRILSTRPPPSVDQKVVAMLREFFRKRPPQEKVRELGILKDEPVFGSNLIDLCQREGTKVPAFVTRVIRAVESRGLETSGLYRKSGNGAAIQRLRNQVNHSEYYLNSDDWDIYELSDSLKLFLRELKEPLLVYALYDEFEKFKDSMSSFSTEQNIEVMRDILAKMPDCHYATTKTIVEHLSKVAGMSSVNQMNSKNLALVFGPNVMWRDTPSDDYALFSLVGCACMEFLITNYAAIFQPSANI
ncbi:unnamed protein product [Hymenolepis diminuta]|uniref:Rho-GAP domain-containing protein n=1 Tax=Hymenolepis diminuta TaxID=6216 RepID=A0A564YZ38_HYMDI|nr:unnamed protein product [Hymenolepis diminuta]